MSRHGPARRDAGFTLIELLVVVMIIGVLAAIAWPSYIGLQNAVQQAATQSDLGNARTALIAYGIDNNGVVPATSGFDPRASSSNLVGYGWQQSFETRSYRYYANSDRSSWCLDMTNSTGVVFRISPNTPTTAAPCSSLAVSSY